MATKVHGRLLAGEAGELVGVSGTTIGQWARHGYIRPSQSAELPHVYSVEDVGEASIVSELLRRGVRHADIRRAIAELREYGAWPLSEAQLATTTWGGKPRIVLREKGGTSVLTERGWQVVPSRLAECEDVRLRLRHAA
jgi:DNA-binding transcriptional MerR regulator